MDRWCGLIYFHSFVLKSCVQVFAKKAQGFLPKANLDDLKEKFSQDEKLIEILLSSIKTNIEDTKEYSRLSPTIVGSNTEKLLIYLFDPANRGLLNDQKLMNIIIQRDVKKTFIGDLIAAGIIEGLDSLFTFDLLIRPESLQLCPGQRKTSRAVRNHAPPIDAFRR